MPHACWHPAGASSYEDSTVVAVLSVLVIVALSMFITRVATVALILTGMSRESARFQARSALTSTGFATRESEAVVNHPVRRQVIVILMLVGSAGIVTVVATLMLSFVGTQGAADAASRVIALAGGLLVLFFLATNERANRAMQGPIRAFLRRYTDLDVRDYAALLHVHGEFAVSELRVGPGSWLAGRDLHDLRLADEGVLVLGIERHDGYVGSPRGDHRCDPGDLVILCGPAVRLEDLGQRSAGTDGDAAHRRAVEDQQRRERQADP